MPAMVRMAGAAVVFVSLLSSLTRLAPTTVAFQFQPVSRSSRRTVQYAAGDWDDTNSNQWQSIDVDGANNNGNQVDWQDELDAKKDGSFWTTFDPISSDDDDDDDDDDALDGAKNSAAGDAAAVVVEDETELWLDTLAALSAEEVDFNLKEASRADTLRQMEEWGFDSETISSSLGVATDDSLETTDDVEGMQAYREESFLDEVDLETVESHKRVEIDEETGEPVRTQMVYVDEHTCIGCTNCAMIAQSTFFMHQEHGRARVFSQWGDDDETIQVAIETCPVDCIHYVPYDELVRLEKGRRGQNINHKARLVSQAENGNNLSHRVGGAVKFTAPQQISGNMGSRCNNCPSRGCRDCPMYGVGKNPEFEKKEQARKAKIAKRKLQQQRERDEKSADL